MKDEKIVFADIDGVLNSRQSITNAHYKGEYSRYNTYPAPYHVKQLNKIIELTNAKVVISSTWRIGKSISELRHILLLADFKGNLVDTTPILDKSDPDIIRGMEIRAWLDLHPDIRKFVILDEDSDMGNLTPHLVQTTFEWGLTEEHIDKAVKILTERIMK